MTFDEHRDARRLGASQLRSAEELAAVRRLGRQWRDAWRSEKAALAELANGSAAAATVEPKPAEPRKGARAGESFAAGIARAEFGRFYWNETLDTQLKAAMTRSPKRDGKKRR